MVVIPVLWADTEKILSAPERLSLNFVMGRWAAVSIPGRLSSPGADGVAAAAATTVSLGCCWVCRASAPL